jgi:NAD(P)H-hydrate epimerase
MSVLPDKIYSVAAVRDIDRTAIMDAGIPGYTLMSRAASAAMTVMRSRYPEARRWQIVCGAGNNAGDGYVLARLAAAAGLSVSVTTLVDPARLSGDAAIAYADFVAADGIAVEWSGELDPAAEVIVDAMLGSGLDRDVGGKFAIAVDRVNGHPGHVVALDIPTGLHGDSGQVLGAAVCADLTVTFVGLKAGLFLGDGPNRCGNIEFAGLDIDDRWRAEIRPVYQRVSAEKIRASLGRRDRAAHKGDFGHVLVVGGAAGMPGAIRLCGEAALRSGAGVVSVATDAAHAATIVATRPELMAYAIHTASDLEPLLERASVIAFGPGLGRSPWAGGLVARLSSDKRPSVWDADALRWLAESPARADNRVITPHPGEASVLLESTASAIQADRDAALRALQDRFGGVVVLKGSGSLVSSQSGTAWFCTSGNPGMAAPGMGDVLTGIIAALMAQGMSAEDSAALGVEIHAQAGDRAAKTGERGLLASDLLAELRGLINP